MEVGKIQSSNQLKLIPIIYFAFCHFFKYSLTGFYIFVFQKILLLKNLIQMTIAIIDCGTNTFNLLISNIDSDGGHRNILNTKKSVKLGEGGLIDNKIADSAFQRGVKVFSEFVKIARDHKVDHISAVATSAVRSTINGPDFVKKVFDKTGVMIQVINGDTEAQYIFKGVNLALEEINQPVLIMDIGGGSTEFIMAEDNQVIWKRSFDLGASRIIQELKPDDPVSQEDITKIKSMIKETLHPLTVRLKNHPFHSLIGCSGSFESLADIIKADKNIDSPFSKIYRFDHDDFYQVYQQLILSNEKERREMPGLVEYRVDTIVLAAIFIRYIVKKFKVDKMYYSSYSLKEGVLSDIIKNNTVSL